MSRPPIGEKSVWTSRKENIRIMVQARNVDRLDDIHLPDGRRQITYEHEWREGFLGEALSIMLDADRLVEWIEFYASDHGVVRWTPGKAFGDAKRWQGHEETGETVKLARDSNAWLGGAADVSGEVIAQKVLHKMVDSRARDFVTVQLKWSGEPLRWFEKDHGITVHRKPSVLMPR